MEPERDTKFVNVIEVMTTAKRNGDDVIMYQVKRLGSWICCVIKLEGQSDFFFKIPIETSYRYPCFAWKKYQEVAIPHFLRENYRRELVQINS